MTLNYNSYQLAMTAFYMMQPGDGTCYRFSITKFPLAPNEAYVIDPGVGNDAEAFVLLTINMPGGCGTGTIGIESLMNLGETNANGRVSTHLLDYAASHGFQSVNGYTLAAVLLACRRLVLEGTNLKDAAAEMLRAPHLLVAEE